MDPSSSSTSKLLNNRIVQQKVSMDISISYEHTTATNAKLQDVTATLATDYGYLCMLRVSCLEAAASAFGPVNSSDELSGPGVQVYKNPRYSDISGPRLFKGLSQLAR